MTLQELKKNLTELMQARVGWDRAEAYAEDVTAWMARKGLRVVEPDDTVTAAGNRVHCGLQSHDGYAPHSHEVRHDHKGVKRL